MKPTHKPTHYEVSVADCVVFLPAGPISGTMREEHASNTPPNFWPFPPADGLGEGVHENAPKKGAHPSALESPAAGLSGEVGGGSHLGHQQLWADMGFLGRCGHILPFILNFEQRAGNLQNMPKKWKFPCAGQFSPDWPKFPQKHKITRKSSEFPCSWQFLVFFLFWQFGPNLDVCTDMHGNARKVQEPEVCVLGVFFNDLPRDQTVARK